MVPTCGPAAAATPPAAAYGHPSPGPGCARTAVAPPRAARQRGSVRPAAQRGWPALLAAQAPAPKDPLCVSPAAAPPQTAAAARCRCARAPRRASSAPACSAASMGTESYVCWLNCQPSLVRAGYCMHEVRGPALWPGSPHRASFSSAQQKCIHAMQLLAGTHTHSRSAYMLCNFLQERTACSLAGPHLDVRHLERAKTSANSRSLWSPCRMHRHPPVMLPSKGSTALVVADYGTAAGHRASIGAQTSKTMQNQANCRRCSAPQDCLGLQANTLWPRASSSLAEHGMGDATIQPSDICWSKASSAGSASPVACSFRGAQAPSSRQALGSLLRCAAPPAASTQPHQPSAA
jgi:hypothetical protein